MSDSTVTGNASAASDGKNGSHPPVADVKELGGQLVNAARNGANSLYEEQRNRAAEEIAALGGALDRSAKSLDGAIGEALAPYAREAARQVGDFADTLRHRSLTEVGNDVEGFARQWPTAFIAASIGLGFLAGRFLLSSKTSTNDMADNAGMQSSAKPTMPAQYPATGTTYNNQNQVAQNTRSGAGRY